MTPEYFVWSDSPPPPDTVVYGSYCAPFEWSLFRTCKGGCCVRAEPNLFGCMTIPRYWKPVENERSHK